MVDGVGLEPTDDLCYEHSAWTASASRPLEFLSGKHGLGFLFIRYMPIKAQTYLSLGLSSSNSLRKFS